MKQDQETLATEIQLFKMDKRKDSISLENTCPSHLPVIYYGFIKPKKKKILRGKFVYWTNLGRASLPRANSRDNELQKLSGRECHMIVRIT